MELSYKKKKRLQGRTRKIIIGTVVGVFLVGLLVVFGLFRIQQVEVTGNEYYSADEIKKMVMSDSLAQNSLYLAWKFRNTDYKADLPYLNAVEIEMLAPYKVRIRVYEKAIIGYIKKSGSNVYFDKEGTIIENSQKKREGVPMITGVEMDKPELLKKLPVKDNNLFQAIISLTQLLNKYEILPEEIHFDGEQSIYLYFENNTVKLGANKNLDEKISNLKSIYSKMETMEGILDMENYSQESGTVTFKKGDKIPEELQESETEAVSETTGAQDKKTDGTTGDTTKETTEKKDETSSGAGTTPKTGESSGSISQDTSGNQIYTDEQGNVTSDMTQQYLGSDGEIISDGYGHIDPYTGAYILN